jgi:hypothetical protein
MLVIPFTRDPESGRIEGQSQPRKKFMRSHLVNKPCMVVHVYNPRYREDHRKEYQWFEASPRQNKRPSLKNN